MGVIREEEDTGTDVGRVRSLSDELDGERAARGGDTVCAGIIGSVNSAVLGASDGVRAKGGVPEVTGVAIGGSAGGMEPTPIGIENDSGRERSATTAR